MDMKMQSRTNAVVDDVGQLDERVTILVQTETANNYGELVKTWDAIDGEEWAKVDFPTTGNEEGYAGPQEYDNRRIEVTVMYRGDVTTKNRLIYEAEEYDIVHVKPLGRDLFEVYTCIRRASGNDYLTTDGNINEREIITTDSGELITVN